MVFGQAREYLGEYIRHREQFEERIREKFPVIHSLRRMRTEVLKSIRGALEPPEALKPRRTAAKRGNHQ